MTSHRLIDIASAGLSAQIDPLGAQLHALRDADGRDLQWAGNPAVWSGRAPILFPIVGMLVDGRYRLQGKTYHLGKHGFARHKWFEVIETEASAAVFRLRADDETRLSYPFEFELDIRFKIEGAALALEATIRNLGDLPMPASFGFHPAFQWPLPYGAARSEHRIQFAQEETAPIRRMDSRGLLQRQSQPTPVVGDTLVLRDELFAADALMFDRLDSQTLRYGPAVGRALRVGFPATPYLGLWTKPGADFIAIEPWHGINDTEGFDGDLWDKPGIFAVEPGESRVLTASVTLTD